MFKSSCSTGAFDIKNIVDRLMEEVRLGCFSKLVVHFFAKAARADQSRLLEQAKVMGDRRGAHLHRKGNVVDTFFAMTEQQQDFEACGVADELKDG